MERVRESRVGAGRCMGRLLPGNKLTARCMVALDVWSDFVVCDKRNRWFTIVKWA